MSNSAAKKEFPDQKQRKAVAYSQWRKKHGGKAPSKTIKSCHIPISIKEEDGEFYSEGFVATTHPDRASDGEVDGEILSKTVIQQIVDFINSGVATIKSIGSTRTVSVNHDWVKEGDADKEPAGMSIPPAEVKSTGDGHFGAFVKTHHNQKHPDYEDISYKVKHGYFPGYSIEYIPGMTEKISVGDKVFRLVKTLENFVGYAFASARKIANPSALITGYGYKEIEEIISVSESKEVNKMKEKVKESEEKAEEPEEKEESKESEEKSEEEKSEESEEEEPEQKTVKPQVDVKAVLKEIRGSPEYKEALKAVKVESKVVKTGTEEQVDIRIKEMNDALEKNDIASFNERAVQYIDDNDLFNKTLAGSNKVDLKSSLKVKVVGKGLKIIGGIQTKGTLDTASNASDYTQAPVEFADLFAPGIIDTFNNQTNFWGFLNKEQHLGGIHYQWKMVVNKDPDSNATFVDRDDTSVLKNFADKKNYQTPLKVARRGISVTDFTLRYSARSLGDLFQLEVDLQMKEMMNDVDKALFAEVADGTGNDPLGLEAVADAAGNTTLYGLTRSTANRLSPATATDTYEAIGGSIVEATLRLKLGILEAEGCNKSDLVIVTHPKVRDYLLNLQDTNRRFITTEAKFGFDIVSQVAQFDGHPIITDHNCNSDALYIIDKTQDVIVIGMEPKLISLAKVGAATEAYVEMHFAHVYKQPRRINMMDTLSGPTS